MAAGESPAFAAPAVVVFASELAGGSVVPPEWSRGGTTRYLVVADVPEPVLPRVFSALDLRKPDQRVHVTRDTGVVRRLLVASARREPMLGIVDAFVWNETLTLVTGDLAFRSFPAGRVPVVAKLASEERHRFEIGADGSHLYWPSGDIHLGVSQILQQADPMYLADIAIKRDRQDHTGAALRRLREEKGLRQTDIAGLSERQVRRIEEGISRLRVPSAEKFAAAFGMDVGTLLDEVARYAGESRLARSPGSRG
ncbi:MAG TPA: helix-turn-helix domain-containing protein [Longimicrobium sp.]|jgi:hypothetical protein